MGRPTQHISCTETGCHGDHYAKGLCRPHYQSRRTKTISQKMGFTRKKKAAAQISACHGKPVFEGAQHENGKQYCTKCKAACLWRYV